jgi:hypothetical protein
MPDDATPPPELAFVVARGQNAFFVELVDVLHREVAALGVTTSVTVGAFPPPSPSRIYVVLPPHEYASLEGPDAFADPAMLGRTIVVCAEQPGSQWFDRNLSWAHGAGAVFDINPRAVDVYRCHGIDARLLPIGYTRQWDSSEPDGPTDDAWDDARDIDVLFLGSRSARRDAVLARCADVLRRHRSHLVISDNDRPNVVTTDDFVAGADKHTLLCRARTLLNVHVGDEPYFEWLRVVEAMHAGAVVVSEQSTGMLPLRAGRDLVVASTASLPWVLADALADDQRLRAMRRAALGTLRGQPMGGAAAAIAFAAARLTRRPIPSPVPTPDTPRRPVVPPAPDAAPWAPAAPSAPTDGADLRRALKALHVDLLELRRRVSHAALAVDGTGAPLVEIVACTPAYSASPTPDVTVAVSVLDDGDRARDAIESVARSTGVRVEVVVVDDASTDDTCATVARWMEGNAGVPVLLARHPAGRGTGATRNTAIDLARGRFIFVLDAGNALYPGGLAALVDAFDLPDVAFTYGMLECFDDTGPTGLRNTYAWNPGRLADGNVVDAMALLRTRVVREAGGFSTDLRLDGWEEYDLWCTLAERGYRGSLVPAIVGRRRISPSSRVLTEIDHDDARARLRERHPRILAVGSAPS